MQEDALIGLRHLRHFVDSGRLVYNTDTSTLGATAPLFWILSGVGYWILHTLHLAGDLLAYHYDFVFCCWAATLIGLVALARGPLRIGMAAYAVVVLSLFVYGLRFMYLGLEGPFLSLSLLLVFVLIAERVPTHRALFACGALAWDRPEIAMVALPVLIAVAILHDASTRDRVRCGAGLAIGWGLPPLLMLVFTGELMPNTVRAKSYFGDGLTSVAHRPFGFVRDRLDVIDVHIGSARHASLILIAVVAGHAVWSTMRATRALRARRAGGASASREIWRAALGLFAAGYAVFILAVPDLWPWYVTYWLMFSLIVIGFIVHDALAFLRTARAWPNTRVAIAACVVAAIAVGTYVDERSAYHSTRTSTVYWISQESQFRGRLGRDLATRWHATSVWMEAAGWQGYYNDARIYDEVGLVDSAVFGFAERYGCGYFMAAMRELRPQYVVKRKLEIDENAVFTSPRVCPAAPLFVDAASRAEFFAHYRQVAAYDAQDEAYFGALGHLLLFQRIDP